MAKEYYKIPTALDKSPLDIEIALKRDDGVGLKPTQVRSIIFYILGVLILFYFQIGDLFKASGAFLRLSLIVVWIAMLMLLGKTTGTKELGYKQAISFIQYFPKKARRIYTRRSSKANSFYHFVGIDEIDDESGLITFNDGDVGFMYRSVGSASILLFDKDKNDILDRVDKFYRKVGFDAEFIFITNKEAQKVYEQLASLKKRYDNLKVKNDDLLKLMEEQYDVLVNYVGTNYRSIHQYMIIKAQNLEALRSNNNVFINEIAESSMMFKQAVHLLGSDIEKVLCDIYQSGKGR